jgi:hypothetical protein
LDYIHQVTANFDSISADVKGTLKAIDRPTRSSLKGL